MSAISRSLQDSMAVLASLEELEPSLLRAVAMCAACLESGGKLLICGNGGSAAEAMHLVSELVGRYKSERAPLAAISLGSDPALASCIGNDYSYKEVFSRQLRALGRRGDLLVAFTTSGCSPNVIQALRASNEIGIESVAFLGRDGGPALELATQSLLVRHNDTARIQEGHQFLMHSLVELLEIEVAESSAGR
jgi:D-sedoheptulose 7-phosphate isomerase